MFILGVFLFSALGQKRKLHFEYLTVENGLVQNTVHGISKDKYGFMWFGTWNGLCRYDGYKFRVYRSVPGDTTSLSSNRIHLIYNDTLGTLWVAAFDSIVCRYNYETDNFTRYRLSELPREIRDSTNRRVASFFHQTVQGNTAWQIELNVLWQTNLISRERFAYSAGIFDRSELNDDYVFCLYKDDCDVLWIGTSKGGVNKADLNARPFNNEYCIVRNGTNWINTPVKALYATSDEIWLGSNSNGLTVVDRRTGQQKSYMEEGTGSRQLASSNVRSLYKDVRGDMWIGYRTGLDKYVSRTGTFIHYTGRDVIRQIPNTTFYSIIEDKQGNLWIGGLGAVYRYDRLSDAFELYDLSRYFRGSSAMCILADSKNNLWVGSETSGVIRIERDSGGTRWLDIKHYNYDPGNIHSIADNRIYALEEDEAGNIWVGTSNGLSKIQPTTGDIKNYTVTDGLADQYVSKILSDRQGRIWVSHKKGLSRLDIVTGAIRNYSIKEGFQGYEFLDGAGFRDPATGQMFFGGVEGYVSFFPDRIVVNPYPPLVVLTDLRVLNKSVHIQQEVNGRVILTKPVYLTSEIELTYLDRGFSVEFAGLHYSNPEENQYAYMLEGFDLDWISTDASNRTAVYSNLPTGTYTFKVKASNSDGVWCDAPATLKVTMLPPWWASTGAFFAYMMTVVLLSYGVYRIIVAREKFRNQILIEKLKAEKIEAVDRIKSQFFTNISHEFRTPLSLIIDPLRKLITEKTSVADAEGYHQLMFRNAQRLLRLINQLLDFRKVESGALTLRMQCRDMVFFIRHLISSFDFLASQQNIQLVFTPPVLIFRMNFDAEKMDKVLINLISNAFKYTPRNGSIQVELVVPDAGANEADDLRWVVIHVRDTGLGIPAAALEKIFDPFYQVEEPGGVGPGGTGLGLALTRELVALHGGRMEVQSELNHGSCFSVYLPFRLDELSGSDEIMDKNSSTVSRIDDAEMPVETTPEGVLQEDSASDESGRPIVLLVEDSEDMRLYIKGELENDFLVLEEKDGLSGYEKALEVVPDLVLSDVMMPGWDGLTLCRKLKNDERTSHIPVILLTARQSDEYRLEGYETGADDYITKPFSAVVLRSRIVNLIESRQRLRALFRQGSAFEINKISVNLMDEQFLLKAVRVVEDHLSQSEFGPDLFARQLKISRAQLFRKIKALTNQTVLDFTTTIRLNRAVTLLQSGRYTISEVAFQTGFSEHSNFTRSFVRQFGQTPSGFLKEHGISN